MEILYPATKNYRSPLTEILGLETGRNYLTSSSPNGNLEPFGNLSDYDW